MRGQATESDSAESILQSSQPAIPPVTQSICSPARLSRSDRQTPEITRRRRGLRVISELRKTGQFGSATLKAVDLRSENCPECPAKQPGRALARPSDDRGGWGRRVAGVECSEPPVSDSHAGGSALVPRFSTPATRSWSPAAGYFCVPLALPVLSVCRDTLAEPVAHSD